LLGRFAIDNCRYDALPFAIDVHCFKKIFVQQFYLDNFVNLFSADFQKNFYRQTVWRICDETIIKAPTTPKMCQYTTLWKTNDVLYLCLCYLQVKFYHSKCGAEWKKWSPEWQSF